MMAKRELLDLSHSELVAELAACGEPSYRAAQVWTWVWKELASDFTVMSSLPRSTRENLAAQFALGRPEPAGREADDEGTEKVLLSLRDGQAIEAVLIREEDRRTVCVSTQVGCPVGCPFCATGGMGYVRNLGAGEIAAQVLYFARRLREEDERVTHLVVMGMGEPLFNYDATLKAVRNLNHPQGFALGARRFTLSTIGVVPGILRLARENLQLNLAVSLHAPSDTLRRELVPLAAKWPIGEVLAATDAYAQATGRRVSFEYVLLAGVNDRPDHAQALAALLRGRLAHVNLIPFNPAPGLSYRASEPDAVDAFRRDLVEAGVDATVRRSRGARIQAGCGQLRGQGGHPSQPLPSPPRSG